MRRDLEIAALAARGFMPHAEGSAIAKTGSSSSKMVGNTYLYSQFRPLAWRCLALDLGLWITP